MKNIKKSKQSPVLFVSSELSRGLILLAKTMVARGIDVMISVPKSDNEKFLLDIKNIRICKINLFGRTFMFANPKLKDFIKTQNPTIHAFDIPSYKMLKHMHELGRTIYEEIDFGLDMKIWTPDAVSIMRQTRLLSEYNIAPHQKLVTVISPLGVGLSNLLAALSRIDRNDIVIALSGKARGFRARRIVKQINDSGQAGKIIYVGTAGDLPTMFRASFATMSLDSKHSRALKLATAMGRPTVWNGAISSVKPNVPIMENSADGIYSALITTLDLSASKRSAAESDNCTIARDFSIENTADYCLELWKA